MDPREQLRRLIGRKEAPAQPRRLDAALVRRGRAQAGRCLQRLGFPFLQAGERLQIKQAGLPGMPQFGRRVCQVMVSSPRLQKALGVPAAFVIDMTEIQGQLLRMTGQAQELFDHGKAGERQAAATITETLDLLETTAAQLAAEEALGAEERQGAARFAAFVRGFRERAAEQAEAPRLRAQRKVEKAAERARTRVGDADPARMAAELLGKGPALTTTRPAPEAAPRRRRRSDAEDLTPRGAPIEDCLGAPAAEYGACADGIDEVLAQLGPAAGSAALATAPAGLEALAEGDLAVLVLRLLPGLSFLSAAAEVTDEDLAAAVDLQDASAGLGKAAALLLRGARDGALSAGQLVLLVHEAALRWLAEQDDDEAAALREELEDAAALLLRGAEEREAQLQRADRRIAEIEAEAEAQLRQDEYARTVAEVTEGKAVPAERLAAALAMKRGGEARAAARTPRGRKRER